MVCIKYDAYAGTQERLSLLTKLISLPIFPIQINFFCGCRVKIISAMKNYLSMLVFCFLATCCGMW